MTITSTAFERSPDGGKGPAAASDLACGKLPQREFVRSAMGATRCERVGAIDAPRPSSYIAVREAVIRIAREVRLLGEVSDQGEW